MSNTPSVTRLNNYLCRWGREDLQERHESHLLSWGESNSGPCHAVQWDIECKINGVVKGVGTGPTKSAAKQTAAEQALQACLAPDGPAEFKSQVDVTVSDRLIHIRISDMPRRTLIPYFVAAVTGVVSGIYIFKPLFTGANSQK
ncbi:hypothetical protein JOM56_006553 [Amanita muscaria]